MSTTCTSAPFAPLRSVEQHRGDIAHIVAEGIVARLDLRLWDNPSEAECHSGGRERLAAVADLECTLWCAQLGLAQPWFGVAAECHSGGREWLASVAELECTLGCAQLGLAQPWF